MDDQTRDHSVKPASAARGLPTAARHAAVAVAAGVIGFAAVYVTVGGSANRGVDQSAQAAGPASAETVRPVSGAPESQVKSPGTPPAGTPLPTTAGKNPLSVGDMAMFVFKEPHPLPPMSFKDGTGTEVDLSRWKGKVVLLNLWATWCAPCRKEMPDLDRLQAELGGPDFEVVAVSLDRGTDEAPRKFLSEIGATSLGFYHDPTARMSSALKVIGMPATLLIDRQGRQVGRLVGPALWSGADAKRLVRAAIAAPAGD